MNCLLTPETVGKKNWTAKFSGEEGFPAQRENHSAPKLESSWRECVYHLPMNIQYSHQWIQLARKVPFKQNIKGKLCKRNKEKTMLMKYNLIHTYLTLSPVVRKACLRSCGSSLSKHSVNEPVMFKFL